MDVRPLRRGVGDHGRRSTRAVADRCRPAQDHRRLRRPSGIATYLGGLGAGPSGRRTGSTRSSTSGPRSSRTSSSCSSGRSRTTSTTRASAKRLFGTIGSARVLGVVAVGLVRRRDRAAHRHRSAPLRARRPDGRHRLRRFALRREPRADAAGEGFSTRARPRPRGHSRPIRPRAGALHPPDLHRPHGRRLPVQGDRPGHVPRGRPRAVLQLLLRRHRDRLVPLPGARHAATARPPRRGLGHVRDAGGLRRRQRGAPVLSLTSPSRR